MTRTWPIVLAILLLGARNTHAQRAGHSEPAEASERDEALRRSGQDMPWAKDIDADRRATARRLHRLGNQAFGDARFAAALATYERALAVWDHPAIRYNMGECLLRMDRQVEAAHNFGLAIRFGVAPLGQRLYAQAVAYNSRLRRILGTLRVKCDHAGAVVTLDGRELFVAPGEASEMVAPGRHRLVATRPGFAPTMRTVNVPANGRRLIDLRVTRGLTRDIERRFTLAHRTTSLHFRAALHVIDGSADYYMPPIPFFWEWGIHSDLTLEGFGIVPVAARILIIDHGKHMVGLRGGLFDFAYSVDGVAFSAGLRARYRYRVTRSVALEISAGHGLVTYGERAGRESSVGLNGLFQLTGRLAATVSRGFRVTENARVELTPIDVGVAWAISSRWRLEAAIPIDEIGVDSPRAISRAELTLYW